MSGVTLLDEPWLARVKAPLVTIGMLGAGALALHLRDPHRHGSWGLCPFYAATGIYCPGCGGLRAVNDLTDGSLPAALSSNLLVTVAIPVAVGWLLLWLLARWRGVATPRLAERVRRPLTMACALAALAFAVLRNTPAGAWLAP